MDLEVGEVSPAHLLMAVVLSRNYTGSLINNEGWLEIQSQWAFKSR